MEYSEEVVRSVDTLPPYVPRARFSGVLRHFGVSLADMVPRWEDGFRRFHPDAEFEDDLCKASGIIGVMTGVAELGASGRESVLTEFLSFGEKLKRMPAEIAVATGALDVAGGSYGLAAFVHESNPIAGLTVEQLDGIFGAERTGGFKGIQWNPEVARGSDRDIRVWGQLGLGDRWADAPIQTYGFAQTGMTTFFEREVFGGGRKWNPNYREYVEAGSKQQAPGAPTTKDMMRALSVDPFGIALAGLYHANGVEHVRAVPLASRGGDAFYAPDAESFATRKYPLARNVYLVIDAGAQGPQAEGAREYLRYVLSREGQRAILDQGVYFPLPEKILLEERAKLG
ncbi:PstS family phosphate ABC transporter substrate-binding protein [Sinomonas sp. G460-2]|uniref:PstS family phosphate ABC transporter substrate-binding protein n=1 Tax=Sinomonas sp. G460-2 TaxID=3393464 RepID=UPI0039EE6ED7